MKYPYIQLFENASVDGNNYSVYGSKILNNGEKMGRKKIALLVYEEFEAGDYHSEDSIPFDEFFAQCPDLKGLALLEELLKRYR